MAEPPVPVTAELSRFVAGSAAAAWPEEILELGRRHILDTIAAIVVCGERDSARLSREFALRQSGHTAFGGIGAPILGTRLRAALPDAVFASAMTAHGAEINDFCPSAFVQPGPAVVSAGICVAAVDHAPYSTAWLAYHLLGDQEAYRVFYGDEQCTLCADPAWETQRKNLP